MTRASVAWLAAFLIVGTNAGAGSLEATVSTPDGKPLADAAVVIEPVSGAVPKRHRSAAVEQRDREFIPYVTIVQTGTMVEFPNRDPLKHHVYSFSPPKIFEIKLYAGKPMQPVLFDKPGEVAVGCNIHDWMEAYILVVNSPYFAKTGSNGKALIRNVPAGHYRLRVWHPRQKVEPPLRDIEVGATPVRLAMQTDVTPRVSKPKPPVESDKY
jgi:plastocyanin